MADTLRGNTLPTKDIDDQGPATPGRVVFFAARSALLWYIANSYCLSRSEEICFKSGCSINLTAGMVDISRIKF